MKTIRYFPGLTLDQWVHENDLYSLRADIECHCEVYLESPDDLKIKEGKDLTRLILIAMRSALDS